MSKKVNLMIGRFQPFTKGHLKCVEYAYEKLSIPTVIAMINTPDNKVDSKHPFPTSLLLPIYENLFKDNKMVEKIITVKNADIVSIGEQLYNMGYEISSWTCGTDRIDSYKKMADKYKDRAHLSDDFQMLEIKRSDEDISATAARKALIDNDRTEFYKLTPYISLKSRLKNGDIFEILRNQIKSII